MSLHAVQDDTPCQYPTWDPGQLHGCVAPQPAQTGGAFSSTQCAFEYPAEPIVPVMRAPAGDLARTARRPSTQSCLDSTPRGSGASQSPPLLLLLCLQPDIRNPASSTAVPRPSLRHRTGAEAEPESLLLSTRPRDSECSPAHSTTSAFEPGCCWRWALTAAAAAVSEGECWQTPTTSFRGVESGKGALTNGGTTMAARVTSSSTVIGTRLDSRVQRQHPRQAGPTLQPPRIH